MVDGVFRFTTSYRFADFPVNEVRHFTVDPTTARVRDDDTGLDVESFGLGKLATLLLALRTPIWLSLKDAGLIALQIPALFQLTRNGCRLYAGGTFRPEETGVTVVCDGRQTIPPLGATINLKTGEVTGIASVSAAALEKAKGVAKTLHAETIAARARIEAKVNAVCAYEQETDSLQ